MKKILIGFILLASSSVFADNEQNPTMCIAGTSWFISCDVYAAEGLFGAIDGTHVICKKEIDFETTKGAQGQIMVLNASRKIEDTMSKKKVSQLRSEAKKEVKDQYKDIKAKYQQCD